MNVYRTEITSDSILSDNPVHQRLLKAYYAAIPYVKGDFLDLGCGEGRGVELLAPLANSYVGIDKIKTVIDKLKQEYPRYEFVSGIFPPLPFKENQFDSLVLFQVIEHIKKDQVMIEEIHRVLKPGGQALLTTPNAIMTLSRNPWHIREYLAEELEALCSKYFKEVEMRGIAGNDKVMMYYEQNKKSVNKIMRFDFLDLQQKLPAHLLRIPYEILNRFNRDNLKKSDEELVKSITHEDFFVNEKKELNLDLFCILTK